MDKVVAVLRLLARAYLIGNCWYCADLLGKLSSGGGDAVSLLLEAYRLASTISAQRQKIGGIECCLAAPLRQGLEPEVCRIYGGVVASGVCCLECGDLPDEEEYLEAARAVAESGLVGRAAAVAQAPS
ncbi:MAG: hypothetical protein ACP5HD_05665 [Thermoproteus sp.]